MKIVGNFMINLYKKLSIIPITLLIVVGVYQICMGNLLGEIFNGKVTWILWVTQSMIIDTVITVIVIYFLINGFPKPYKKLRDNIKTKGIATFILLASVIMAIILFVIGKLFLNQVVFHINYILLLAVLIILCVLQKFIDKIIYPKNKVNNENA